MQGVKVSLNVIFKEQTDTNPRANRYFAGELTGSLKNVSIVDLLVQATRICVLILACS